MLFTNKRALDTSPPDTKTPCGDNSENICDFPVPLGPKLNKVVVVFGHVESNETAE